MTGRTAAALLALLGLWTACPLLRTEDERARDAIAALRLQGFTQPLPGGGALVVPPGAFDAVNVTASTEQGVLRARGQVSLQGRVGDAIVSYLGSERFQVRCGTACSISPPPVERLVPLLEALQARDAALQARDPAALQALAAATFEAGTEARAALGGAALSEAPPAVTAWLVRVDREAAEVGEARGTAAPRPLRLVREASGWRFTSGLP